MSEACWRVEDEALLRRLEDRTLFRSAWRALVPDAAPPPPSASATVAELRLLSSGRAAFQRAEEGDLSALVACLAELPANDASPRLIHHLALLQERLAQHLSTDAASDAAIEAAARAWARSAELWLRLGHQEHYLGRLAEQVFGSALSPDERRQEVTELALQTVARLGETAVAAAPTLSPGGRIALAALTLVADTERAPDPSAPIERQAVRRARREVDRAVEAALVPIEAGFEDAEARSASTGELAAILLSGVDVWRWSFRHEFVEHTLLQRITPAMWDRYRDREWDDVRRLLRILRGPIDHLADVIADDPSKLAYAATCAQMLVFRSETAYGLDEQLAHAERALRLCPTHRNGRLVLADGLVDRAIRALDGRVKGSREQRLRAAHADVERARHLYPRLKRLGEIERRLAASGGGQPNE